MMIVALCHSERIFVSSSKLTKSPIISTSGLNGSFRTTSHFLSVKKAHERQFLSRSHLSYELDKIPRLFGVEGPVGTVITCVGSVRPVVRRLG